MLTLALYASNRIWRWLLPSEETRFVLICIGFMAAGCGEHTRTQVNQVQLPDLVDTYADVAEAIEDRHDEVVASPTSGDAWGKYGMVLDAHEFREECIPCYERAVEYQPGEPKWAWLLASRIQQTNPERALQLLDQARSDSTTAMPFMVLRLSLLEELGLSDRVDAELQTATEEAKANPFIRVQIARRLFEKREFTKARDLLSSTISGLQLSHQYQDAAQLLARIDQIETGVEDAGNLLNKAETLPTSRTSVTNQIMNELASMRRDPLWLGERAVVQARAGSVLAKSELESLVQRFPDVVPNRIHLALVLLTEKQFQQAEELLNAGLRVDPENERLLMTLAAVDIDRNDWNAAELGLKHVLSLNAANGAAWSDLGFVQEQQSKWSDAAEAYEKALQVLPEDNELYQRLDAVRQRVNRASE